MSASSLPLSFPVRVFVCMCVCSSYSYLRARTSTQRPLPKVITSVDTIIKVSHPLHGSSFFAHKSRSSVCVSRLSRTVVGLVVLAKFSMPPSPRRHFDPTQTTPPCRSNPRSQFVIVFYRRRRQNISSNTYARRVLRVNYAGRETIISETFFACLFVFF